MRELGIVLQREFLERVRSKSFVLSTILTPLFFAILFVGPLLSERFAGDDVRRLSIIDESAEGIGTEVASALATSDGGADGGDRVFVAGSSRVLLEDSLARAVLAEDLDGYIIIPADVMGSGAVQYRARSVTDTGLQRRIGAAVTEAVQARRLTTAGIDPVRLTAIMAPVQIDAARLTSAGTAGESGESSIIFSFMVGFLLYMLILLYGVQVLQSVQEEKTNRIAEIIVSSMRASHLMLGKVLGVGLAGLLQVMIWLVSAVGLAAAAAGPMIAMSPTSEVVSGLVSRLDPGMMAVMLAYLLLGFFLYASLFAAAGAAAASAEDAQRFTFPLIIPLIIPMMMTVPIISAPQSLLSVVLGWFPLTMPLAMPMRIGAGGTSALEVVASLLVLAASVVLLGALAGKIYRIGILSTGKRPGLREIIGWLRTA